MTDCCLESGFGPGPKQHVTKAFAGFSEPLDLVLILLCVVRV